MITDFTDIEKKLPNGQNMGGIPQVVYYALHKDVAVWPNRPVSNQALSLEQMGELVGEIEMKAGKVFRKFYVTDDEGKLDVEGIGEKDGKSFLMKLRIFTPGLNSKAMGFLNLIKNDNLVFIVPDNNGSYFLLGDKFRPSTLDSLDGMSTGQKTEERPGIGMVFTYKTSNVLRYKGKIPIVVVPTTIRACCPDGIDDYLSFSSGITKNLFMPTSSKKMIYTIDLIPGDCIFEFCIKELFLFNCSLVNSQAIMMLFVNGIGYGAMFNSGITDDKRVKMRLELGLEDNTPTLAAFINDSQVESGIDVLGEVISPTEDKMSILTSRGSFFPGKLFSFEITQGSQAITKWDFQGELPDECLKNKITPMMFKLTAHNVIDMGQFIKNIPIPV